MRIEHKIEPHVVADIEYHDAEGIMTNRRVSFQKIIEESGHTYADGFCLSKRALRSFRMDRIACVVTQDGEVIDPKPFFAGLRAASTARGPTITEPRAPNPVVAPVRAAALSKKSFLNTVFWIVAVVWTMLIGAMAFSINATDEPAAVPALAMFAFWALPVGALWSLVAALKWLAAKLQGTG